MTTPARSAPERAAAGPVLVSLPFFVDQDALCFDLKHQEACVPLRECLAALALAVENGLHLGRETLVALEQRAPELKQLSGAERGEMLRRLLTGPLPAAKVDAALRAGLMQRIVPEVERLRTMPRGNGLYKDVYAHTLRVLDDAGDDFLTRLAALLHDVAKPDTLTIENGSARFPNHDLLGADRAARRLRTLAFDEEEVAAVETLVRLHLRANSYEPTWTDSAVRRLRLDAGEHWEQLLALSHADVTSARGEVVARAHRRVQELDQHARSLEQPVESSPLDGTALMQHFGLGPGRWIGLVKQQLLEQVRAGELDPADEAAAWLAAERCLAGIDTEAPAGAAR